MIRTMGKFFFPEKIRKKIIGAKNICIFGLLHGRNYGRNVFPAIKFMYRSIILPAGLPTDPKNMFMIWGSRNLFGVALL